MAPVNDEAKKHNQNLPGMGGIYNTVNFHLYHYAGNNPVKYIDPDGESVSGKILGYGCILGAGVVVIAGAVSAAAGQPYITPGAAALAKGLFLAGTAMLAVDTVADITSANSQTVPSVLGNGMSASASSPNPMPENDGDGNRNDISQSAKDVKKIDSNKEANKFARDKGYKDAHDLKKDYVGKDDISKYDIYRNTKTGESFLIDKSGTTVVSID